MRRRSQGLCTSPAAAAAAALRVTSRSAPSSAPYTSASDPSPCAPCPAPPANIAPRSNGSRMLPPQPKMHHCPRCYTWRCTAAQQQGQPAAPLIVSVLEMHATWGDYLAGAAADHQIVVVCDGGTQGINDDAHVTRDVERGRGSAHGLLVAPQ